MKGNRGVDRGYCLGTDGNVALTGPPNPSHLPPNLVDIPATLKRREHALIVVPRRHLHATAVGVSVDRQFGTLVPVLLVRRVSTTINHRKKMAMDIRQRGGTGSGARNPAGGGESDTSKRRRVRPVTQGTENEDKGWGEGTLSIARGGGWLADRFF